MLKTYFPSCFEKKITHCDWFTR